MEHIQESQLPWLGHIKIVKIAEISKIRFRYSDALLNFVDNEKQTFWTNLIERDTKSKMPQLLQLETPKIMSIVVVRRL